MSDTISDVRAYHEIDALVRVRIAAMRDEPDLAVRADLLAAVARGERDLALSYARAFARDTDRDTVGQVDALLDSSRLMAAIVVATRGALGSRVVLPTWTEAPWRAAAPALRRLATTVDPGDRARALEELRVRLEPHLDQTATETLIELAAVEHAHVPPSSAHGPRRGSGRAGWRDGGGDRVRWGGRGGRRR